MPTNVQKKTYDHDFFDYTGRKSAYAADIISGIICDTFRPSSVCDIGCGEGVWLASYQNHGINDIQGVDGDYVDRTRLRIPKEKFKAHDLSRPLNLNRQFDVIQSLEVAEHLPATSAESFVESLISCAPIVVFSAAVPGQGGLNHVNEQPLDYWRAFFARRGYDAYDLIRPQIRNETDIPPWYRYNVLVYAAQNIPNEIKNKLLPFKLPEGLPTPDVSPLWYRARRAAIAALPYTVQQGLARLVSC